MCPSVCTQWKPKFLDKQAIQEQYEALDVKFGYERVTEGPKRTAWLLNMHTVCANRVGREGPLVGTNKCSITPQTSFEDKETGNTLSAIDYYFLEASGRTFKVTKHYEPYFYVAVKVVVVFYACAVFHIILCVAWCYN